MSIVDTQDNGRDADIGTTKTDTPLSTFGHTVLNLWHQICKYEANEIKEDFGRLAESKNLATHLRTLLSEGREAQEAGHISISKLAFLKKFISELFLSNLEEDEARQIVKFLLLELHLLLPDKLVTCFADHIMDSIECSSDRNPMVWVLLVRLLQLCTPLVLVVDCKGQEMSGVQFKSSILKRLCNIAWENDTIHIISNLKELSMTPQELKEFTSKSVKCLSEVSLEDLSIATNHLFLLGGKGERHKIIRGVISCFSQLDERATRESERTTQRENVRTLNIQDLYASEGAVLVYFDLATKRDIKLGQEFLRVLKETRSPLSPFTLALALSIIPSHSASKLGGQLIDTLIHRILSHYKTLSAIHAPTETFSLQPNIPACHDEQYFERTLVTLVINSKKGMWDLCLKGLLKLAFTLLDLRVARSCTSIENLATIAMKYKQTKASQLGILVLKETFKTHELTRTEILNQIFNRIIVHAESSQAAVSLLSSIVESNFYDISKDFEHKLKDCIDYVPTLPSNVATALLAALEPLLKRNKSLLDHTIMALRKSLFNRDVQARTIAVTGFIQLLKLLVSNDAASASQRGLSMLESNAPQILGFLRRCLDQQFPVREALYNGLCEVFSCTPNEELRGLILSLFASQFAKFYSPDSGFLFTECICKKTDSVIVVEPLPQLLRAISNCLRTSPEECGQLFDEFLQIIKSFVDAELEFYRIDKSTNFDLSTIEGQYNHQLAGLYFGTAEVFIEFLVLNSSSTINDRADLIFKLFQRHHQARTAVKEKEKEIDKEKKTTSQKAGSSKDQTRETETNQKKQPKVKSILSRQPLFSDSTIIALLKLVFSEASEAIDVDPSHLFSLRHFVLTTTQMRVKQLVAETNDFVPLNNNMRRGYYEILPILWNVYSSWRSESTERKELGQKSLALIAVECVVDLMPLIWRNTSTKDIRKTVQKCIGKAVSSAELASENSEKAISSFMETLEKEIQQLIEVGRSKEADAIVELMTQLHSFLSTRDIMQHIQTLDSLAVYIDDKLQLLKKMLSLQWTMALRLESKVAGEVLDRFSQQLQLKLGSLLHDQRIKIEEQYSFKTSLASPLATLQIQHIDRILAQLETMLTSIKGSQSEVASLDEAESYNPTNSPRDQLHQMLCSLLVPVTTLTTVKLQSQPSELLIKLCTRIIKLLHYATADVVSWMRYLKAPVKAALPKPFRELLQTSARLIPNIYAFVYFVHGGAKFSGNSEDVDDDGEGAKGNKRKTNKKGPLKDAKLIPNLIYWIEKFETDDLIKLGDVTSDKVEKMFKRSVARDFRIQWDMVGNGALGASVQGNKGDRNEEVDRMDADGGEDQREDTMGMEQDRAVDSANGERDYSSEEDSAVGLPAAKRRKQSSDY